MHWLGLIKEAVPPAPMSTGGDREEGIGYRAETLPSDGSEVAIDHQGHKSRRKARCEVVESEGKVEPPKTIGTFIFLLPIPTLTLKLKAVTLYHELGHKLCSILRVFEREDMAGAGEGCGPTPTEKVPR